MSEDVLGEIASQIRALNVHNMDVWRKVSSHHREHQIISDEIKAMNTKLDKIDGQVVGLGKYVKELWIEKTSLLNQKGKEDL